MGPIGRSEAWRGVRSLSNPPTNPKAARKISWRYTSGWLLCVLLVAITYGMVRYFEPGDSPAPTVSVDRSSYPFVDWPESIMSGEPFTVTIHFLVDAAGRPPQISLDLPEGARWANGCQPVAIDSWTPRDPDDGYKPDGAYSLDLSLVLPTGSSQRTVVFAVEFTPDGDATPVRVAKRVTVSVTTADTAISPCTDATP